MLLDAAASPFSRFDSKLVYISLHFVLQKSLSLLPKKSNCDDTGQFNSKDASFIHDKYKSTNYLVIQFSMDDNQL